MSGGLRIPAHEFRNFGNRIFVNPDLGRRDLGPHSKSGPQSKKGLQKRPDFSQRIYYFRGRKCGKNIRIRVEGTLIMNLLIFQN